jgi:hypothetical protein
MACYDIDRFRAFVASDGFQALYDLPAAEMALMLEDDEKLLLFGFRFLRQVLFGEATIAVHAEAAERLRERFHAKAARLEREAAARRAREEEVGEFEVD